MNTCCCHNFNQDLQQYTRCEAIAKNYFINKGWFVYPSLDKSYDFVIQKEKERYNVEVKYQKTINQNLYDPPRIVLEVGMQYNDGRWVDGWLFSEAFDILFVLYNENLFYIYDWQKLRKWVLENFSNFDIKTNFKTIFDNAIGRGKFIVVYLDKIKDFQWVETNK